jgi:UDP-N-acetylglucosamine 2-epimerase (non-hydrolysing)
MGIDKRGFIMKKVILVFGTRPEAIKMCPLVKELKQQNWLETLVCVTGQHRHMLDQVLKTFDVEPEYDLNIMKENQNLFDLTEAILKQIKPILIHEKPDMVLVHGDTCTSFASALACFYLQIPIGHVEAGLRTYRIDSPYPEEFYRQAIGSMATLHFAPTDSAKNNLLREGKSENNIFVTGNTGIDALQTTVVSNYSHPHLDWTRASRLILITAHRRENLGEPMRQMFRAIKRVCLEHPDIKVIYPVHQNPKVQSVANEIFGDMNQIRLINPLEVLDFHNFMKASYLILTDSGGIQEEAPSLGVPVLVMRDTTERPEGIQAKTLRLVGTQENTIYEAFTSLLTNKTLYQEMSQASNPYGDGKASIRIKDILKNFFNMNG